MVQIAQSFLRVFSNGKFFRGHRDFMSTVCPGNEIYGFIHSKRFLELVEGRVSVDSVVWPIPTPQWFIDWMLWLGKKKKGPRPAKVPVKIPKWAFALRKRMLS